MKELKSFSSLPNYFSLFMKNKECIELLFELLAGLPDEIPLVSEETTTKTQPGTNLPTISSGGITSSTGSTTQNNGLSTTTITTTTTTSSTSSSKQNSAGAKKWDEEEQKAVHYSYQVLKDTFKLGQDNSVRDTAMENKLIQVILDRIAIVSKEVKRTFIANPEAQLELDAAVIPSTEPTKSVMKLPSSATEDDTKKKPITKKGIGYGSDNTG